ncbi:hypothetical protein L873DRAFT_1846952 [Choiromyces venosus 120613-1]|uniref:Uncharacterized protein n=1 Tax=Choiromyces venosus 120613-1 TaxID=1336337 RepID=A0A3N4J6X7_9PEZI|nr:hypothetical protein L873DRAFT_1846952 [Choiromyces venosus 120613-1]
MQQLEAYTTAQRTTTGIRLETAAPPFDASVKYYSAPEGFFAVTGARFEVQAGMHRLHVVRGFAHRQAQLQPPVIIPVGFIADIYNPHLITPGGGEDGHKHLDTKSLDVLRRIRLPRTEDSVKSFFQAWSNIDLMRETSQETDRHRRRDLFTKMTTEEYMTAQDVLIEYDRDYEFPKLKQLVEDNKTGVMAIANSLGMHVCCWLELDSMQEARNSPINSRASIREVLSAFPIIADDPTHVVPVPPAPVAAAGPAPVAPLVAPVIAIPKATLTHFEDALCNLVRRYRVDFSAGNAGMKPVLSITSLAAETVAQYRRQFVDTTEWRALMELVVTYFGADSLVHKAVAGFVLVPIKIKKLANNYRVH